MNPELDDEIAETLKKRAASPSFPYHSLSVNEAREALNRHLSTEREPPTVGHVREISIGENPSLPIRIYTPDVAGPFPVLIYFHGGGWVLGNLDTHDALCRELTRQAEIMVVSVAYRRAPEHTFPAAVDDAYQAVQWTADNINHVDGNPEQLAVGGDSVGGTLATVVSMIAREHDGPSLRHQLLIHPVTDTKVQTRSYDQFSSGYVGSKAGMEQYWDYYLRDKYDAANPYAAPLRARQLGDLPPARVITCENDPLRDEGIAYADRLDSASVLLDHTHETDVFHGYFVSVQFLNRAERGVANLAEGLRSAFQRED